MCVRGALLVLALPLLLGTPARATGACGTDPADSRSLDAAQAAADTQCDCCRARTRGEYVRCVARVAKTAVHARALRRACKGMLMHRAASLPCPLAATGPAATSNPLCRVCSGDADCAADEFCECPPGACSKTGGTCVARPPVCFDVVAPVCGCDGTTYPNDCERRAAGVCKKADGPCQGGQCFDTIRGQCTGIICSAGRRCPLPNQACVDACPPPPPTGGCFGVPDGRCTGQSCAPGSPCPPGSVCLAQCPPPAGRCFVTVDRQCSDRTCSPDSPCTNPNEFCSSLCFSTTTTTLPACQTDGDCDDGNPCTADVCRNGVCEHGCVCASAAGGLTCCPGPAGSCVTTTTTTLPERSCATDAECGVGQFCECVSGTCSKTGGRCATRPQACPDVFAPVCGCDGTTYPNDCERQVAGACKLHDGACPPMCRTSTDCDDGNPCTADICTNGVCEHGCVCATAGGLACCPGPAALCVRPCASDGAGLCGGICPSGAACETVPGGTTCGYVSGLGGPCGGNILAPPPVCAAGLVCQQSNPDATGVCVATTTTTMPCIPFFQPGCSTTSDCCQPCGPGIVPPCAVCLQGRCMGAP